MTCSVNGCTGAALSRGWCKKHYTRWLRHGDVDACLRIFGDDVARFWSYVDKNGPLAEADTLASGLGRCWAWRAPLATNGYARVQADGKKQYAHRVSYRLAGHLIPDDLVLDHLCRNRGCVNPAHLEPVTQGENVRRGTAGDALRAKTHCPQGHPYDEANTRMSRGSRLCRACGKAKRKRAQRRVAA